MKIFLATWNEDSQGASLNAAGNRHRLFSYFFLKDLNSFLKNYVEKAEKETRDVDSDKEV